MGWCCDLVSSATTLLSPNGTVATLAPERERERERGGEGEASRAATRGAGILGPQTTFRRFRGSSRNFL